MKFNCGLTSAEKWEQTKEKRKVWHKWFAWRPVRVGSGDCRWLEYVERKGSFECSWGDCWWSWEYRSIR